MTIFSMDNSQDYFKHQNFDGKMAKTFNWKHFTKKKKRFNRNYVCWFHIFNSVKMTDMCEFIRKIVVILNKMHTFLTRTKYCVKISMEIFKENSNYIVKFTLQILNNWLNMNTFTARVFRLRQIIFLLWQNPCYRVQF